MPPDGERWRGALRLPAGLQAEAAVRVVNDPSISPVPTPLPAGAARSADRLHALVEMITLTDKARRTLDEEGELRWMYFR